MTLSIALPKDAAAREAALGVLMPKLRSLSPSHAYVVEIRQHRPRHSDEQRAYLWGVVYKAVADYCGCTADEVHDHAKAQFLCIGTTDGGIKRVRSVSRLSVDELSQYIERVIAWAETELGVLVPPAIPGRRPAQTTGLRAGGVRGEHVPRADNEHPSQAMRPVNRGTVQARSP